MENKSSNGWKFFALLFGGLLAALVGLYIYKQQNPDYDPWEEPWENSSSPVDLGLNKAEDEAADDREDSVSPDDFDVFDVPGLGKEQASDAGNAGTGTASADTGTDDSADAR